MPHIPVKLSVSPERLAALILQCSALKIVQTKKHSSKLKSIKIFGNGIGLAALILQSSALKIVQTKKTLKQAWRFFLLHYLFVSPEGFEPSTASLEGRCSIQLTI